MRPAQISYCFYINKIKWTKQQQQSKNKEMFGIQHFWRLVRLLNIEQMLTIIIN